MKTRTLKASILIASTEEITDQVRDNIIKRLIENMNGYQDQAFGTVCLDLPGEDRHEPAVNLMLHEWE